MKTYVIHITYGGISRTIVVPANHPIAALNHRHIAPYLAEATFMSIEEAEDT